MKSYRIIFASYALIIAFLKLIFLFPYAELIGKYGLSISILSFPDIMVISALIISAISLIKKIPWSGTLYIFSMGMIMPEIVSLFISLIGGSYYFGSILVLIMIILTATFGFTIRLLTEEDTNG